MWIGMTDHSKQRFVSSGFSQQCIWLQDQELIEGCDCYNYCNGEFNGCCGYFEAVECEQDCDGLVVSGCELDFPDANMTVSPNATDPPEPPGGGEPQPPGSSPNATDPLEPPGSGEPQLPGGSGPQPPGGVPEPPGGTSAPGGGTLEPSRPPGGSTPEPPGSPGGNIPEPPGSPGTAPGARQFVNNGDLIVTLPPYALRFFLPNRKEADNLADVRKELFVPNTYPSLSDYTALESVTNAFLKGYVMDTIGNGLNVVLDDLETIVLSKPGVQNDRHKPDAEVAQAGGQGGELSSVVPFDSLFIVFVSTATFDSTSPTIPHTSSLLKHVQDAFAGNSLTSYLSMLQALKHSDEYASRGDFFASTTDIVWVAANPSSGTANSSYAPNQVVNSQGIGPVFIAIFSIAILILFMMILRLNGGLKCLNTKEKKSKRETEFDNIFKSTSLLEINEIENDYNQASFGGDTGDAIDSSDSGNNNNDDNGEEERDVATKTFQGADPPGVILDPPANIKDPHKDKQQGRRGLGRFWE
jgi:hypothetical protein